MQVYRQIAALFDCFLDADDVREDLALIVGCAARKDVAVFENRLERRRIPKLQWIGWLYIVMPVDQNRAASGLMFVARPDDRVPFRGNKLCLSPMLVSL